MENYGEENKLKTLIQQIFQVFLGYNVPSTALSTKYELNNISHINRCEIALALNTKWFIL